MKLKEIIDSVSWDEVSQVLKNEYEEDWNKSSFGFENVFNRLREIEPKQSDRKIIVYKADDLVYGGQFVGVSHLKNGERWVASFTSWREWLGMNVTKDSLKEFKLHEIAAHCLWEMTYYGFSEVKIEESEKNMVQAVTEALEEINKK